MSYDIETVSDDMEMISDDMEMISDDLSRVPNTPELIHVETPHERRNLWLELFWKPVPNARS